KKNFLAVFFLSTVKDPFVQIFKFTEICADFYNFFLYCAAACLQICAELRSAEQRRSALKKFPDNRSDGRQKAVENLRNYRQYHGKNQNNYSKKSPAVKITYRENYLQ